VGDELPVKTNTANTGYDVADTSNAMTDHTDVTAVTSLATFTVGAGKSITIGEAGAVIDAINETSHYAVLQMVVANTAVQGDTVNDTLTYSFSES